MAALRHERDEQCNSLPGQRRSVAIPLPFAFSTFHTNSFAAAVVSVGSALASNKTSKVEGGGVMR